MPSKTQQTSEEETMEQRARKKVVLVESKPPQPPPQEQPPRCALFVGVSAFQSPDLSRLPGAARDARALCTQLDSDPKGYGFRWVDLLTEGEVTLKRFHEKLGELCTRVLAQPNSLALLYLATHGFYADDAGEEAYHLCFCDSEPKHSPPKKTLTLSSLQRALQEIRDGGHAIVLILDACREESQGSAHPISAPALHGEDASTRAFGAFARWEDKFAVLTSASRGQQAYESASFHSQDPHQPQRGVHGLFTRQLLAELRAAGEGSAVRVEELHDAVSRRVKHELLLIRQNVEQKPQLLLRRSEPIFLFQRSRRATLAPLARPFRPLEPFGEGEGEHFFGRDGFLRDMVGAQGDFEQRGWLLGDYRHHLLLGPSGVGKSSLLRAGVWPRLHQKSHKVFYVNCRQPSLFEQLRDYLNCGEQSTDLTSLVERCQRALPRPCSEVILVLDQFESFLLEPQLRAPLAKLLSELESLSKASQARAQRGEEALGYRLLLGLREDCLSFMHHPLPWDPHKGPLMERLGLVNQRQIRTLSLLTREEAQEVIERSLRHAPAFPSLAPDALVALLSDLESHFPRPKTEAPSSFREGSIYPPYLQIVCDELFQAALRDPAAREQIDLSFYQREGALSHYLKGYLERSLGLDDGLGELAGEEALEALTEPQRQMAWSTLTLLATQSRLQAILPEELLVRRMKDRGHEEGELRRVLSRLSDRRLLVCFQLSPKSPDDASRGAAWWGFSHDFLQDLVLQRLEEDEAMAELLYARKLFETVVLSKERLAPDAQAIWLGPPITALLERHLEELLSLARDEEEIALYLEPLTDQQREERRVAQGQKFDDARRLVQDSVTHHREQAEKEQREQQRLAREERRSRQLQRVSVTLGVALLLLMFGYGLYDHSSTRARAFASAWQKAQQAFHQNRRQQSLFYLDRALAVRPGFLPAKELAFRALDGLYLHRRTLSGHSNDIDAVQWSPDGRLLASSSFDGTARIWDPKTGALLKAYSGQKGELTTVDWHPRGKVLVTASLDGTLHIWSWKHGKTLQRIPMPRARRASPSDAAPKRRNHAFSARWSPDGRWIAASYRDGSVQVWDVARRAWFRRFHLQSKNARSVAWHPTYPWLAVATRSGCASVWDVKRDRLLHRVWHTTQDAKVGHAMHRTVSDVKWHPKSHALVTSSWQGSIKWWRMTSKSPFRTLTTKAAIDEIAFSPDGTQMAAAGWDRKLYIWQLEGGGVRLFKLEGHTNKVFALDWHPDGERLATAAQDREVKIWRRFQRGQSLRRHSKEVYRMAWHPWLPRLATAGADAIIRVWDVPSGQSLLAYRGHRKAARVVDWRRDGQWIASGSLDETTQVWDAQTGKRAFLHRHTGYVDAVRWSPKGRRLLSASWDHTARLWDVSGARTLRFQSQTLSRFKKHKQFIEAAWRSDGRLLALASFYHLRILSGLGSRAAIKVAWQRECHDGHTMDWHPRRSWLAVSCTKGGNQVLILDTQQKRLLKTISPRGNTIGFLDWHPHKELLAISTWDGVLGIWELQATPRLAFQTPGLSGLWSPDGKLLAATQKGGWVKVLSIRNELQFPVAKLRAMIRCGVTLEEIRRQLFAQKSSSLRRRPQCKRVKAAWFSHFTPRLPSRRAPTQRPWPQKSPALRVPPKAPAKPASRASTKPTTRPSTKP